MEDDAYEESERYYESDDYSSDEEDNLLEDFNGELVSYLMVIYNYLKNIFSRKFLQHEKFAHSKK